MQHVDGVYRLADLQKMASLTEIEIIESYKISGEFTGEWKITDIEFKHFYVHEQKLTAVYGGKVKSTDEHYYLPAHMYISKTEKGFEGSF